MTAIPDKTIEKPHQGVTITKSDLRKNNNKEDREASSNILKHSGEPKLYGNTINRIGGGRQREKNYSSSRVSDTQPTESALKWQEFAILVNKYYSKATAREILTCANLLFLKGKDDLVEIDEKLALLRNIDRCMSDIS